MKKQIGSRQLGVMVFIYMFVVNAEITIRMMLSFVKQDMWITFIISRTLGLFLLLFIIRIITKLKDRSIYQINIDIMGKIFGRLLNIIFIGIFYFFAFLIFYQYIDILFVDFLFPAPKLSLAIIFILVSTYGVYQGVETLFRAGEIVFIVTILVSIVMGASISRSVDLTNFYPMMNNEIFDLSKAVFYDFSYTCIGLLFLLAFPDSMISTDNNFKKNLLIGYLLSFVLTSIVIVTQIYGIGPLLAAKYYYPMPIATQGHMNVLFIERLDFLSIFPHFVGAILLVSLFMHLIFQGIESVFKLKMNVIVTAIVVGSLTYLSIKMFPNNVMFDQFFTNTYAIYLPLVFLIYPITLSFILDIKGFSKNGKKAKKLNQ